ncbi:MAG: helix-turn-helix domain-containing protein [Dehalococcoidia bacterium]
MADKLLFSIPDAAARLSLGRSKLYELIARGDIAVVRIGRSVRVSARALEAYAARLEGNGE